MANESPATAYDSLRRAVAADVKAARRQFTLILAESDEFVQAVLELASQPGEGRVRQMIATAARLERFVPKVEQWLRRWLAIESHEFARMAIVTALRPSPSEDLDAQPATDEMPLGFVDTYRFVAGRLCHRVQQSLPTSSTALLRLENLIEKVPDTATRSELTDTLGTLRSAFQRLSHTLEFNIGDGYLDWKPIPLGEWLDKAQSSFRASFGVANLTVIGSPQARRTTIRANHFLLETTFGNLWANAVQAASHLTPTECQIAAEFNLVEQDQGRVVTLNLLLRDNGPGFPHASLETAFQLPYSTKGESRGRGLLEIADAVRRLQGTIKLVPVAAKDYRVLISFEWNRP